MNQPRAAKPDGKKQVKAHKKAAQGCLCLARNDVIASFLVSWVIFAVLVVCSQEIAAGEAPVREDELGDRLPRFAVARFGTPRLHHGAGFTLTGFSRDGLVVATGGPPTHDYCFGRSSWEMDLLATTVRLWSVKDGKHLADLVGHLRPVGALAFSPVADLLASCDGQDIILWDIRTKHIVRRWEAWPVRQEVSGTQPVFSPDGQLLLIGTGQQEWHLWEIATGKRRCTLEVPAGESTHSPSVAFGADGKTIVFSQAGSYGQPPRVLLLSSDTGKVIRSLKGQPDQLAFGLTPDNKSLIALGPQSLQFYELATGQVSRELPLTPHPVPSVDPAEKFEEFSDVPGLNALLELPELRDSLQRPGWTGPPGLIVSPNGQTVVWPEPSGVGVIDLPTGTFTKILGDLVCQAPPVMSPNRRLLAYPHPTGRLQIRQVPSSRDLSSKLFGNAAETGSLTFTPDGRYLIRMLDSGWELRDPNTAALRGFLPEIPQTPVDRSPHDLRGRFSEDGQLFLGAEINGETPLWELASGSRVRVIRHQPSSRLNFLPGGKLVIVRRGGDGLVQVRVEEARTGKLVRLEKLTGATVEVSPAGDTLLLHAQEISYWPFGEQLVQPDFGPLGVVFADADFESEPLHIRAVDTETGRKLWTADAASSQVVFSSSGNHVILPGIQPSTETRILEARTGKLIAKIPVALDSDSLRLGGVGSAAFYPAALNSESFGSGGSQFADVAADGRLAILVHTGVLEFWDLTVPKVVAALPFSSDQLNRPLTVFSPTGNRLLTDSLGQGVTLWDVEAILAQAPPEARKKPRLSLALDSSATLLHAAAHAGDLAYVEKLINQGADLNALSATLNDQTAYVSPLHLAALQGHLDIVQELIDRGATINTQDPSTGTPLSLACRSGQIEVVKLLLKRGAKVSKEKPNSPTPLSETCRGPLQLQPGRIVSPQAQAADLARREEILKWLLAAGAAPPQDFSLEERLGLAHGGSTPLLCAISAERPSLAKMLLAAGAKLDVLEPDQLLVQAAQNGRLEIVRLLVEHGARVNRSDPSEYTPLQAAAQSGHHQVIQYLVRHKAKLPLNLGQPPLTLAQKANPRTVADRLIKLHRITSDLSSVVTSGDLQQLREVLDFLPDLANPSSERYFQTQAGQALVGQAALHGHIEMMELLLDRGAHPDAAIPLDDGSQSIGGLGTAMDLAVANGQLEMARFLYARGVPVVRDRPGMTRSVLPAAIRSGQLEMVKWVLQRCAHTPERPSAGFRPLTEAPQRPQVEISTALLHQAIQQSSPDVVRVLLEAGADPNGLPPPQPRSSPLPFRQGLSERLHISDRFPALFVAVEANKPETVRLLARRGANLKSTSAAGLTLLQQAVLGNNLSSSDVLIWEHHRAYRHKPTDQDQMVRLLLSLGCEVDLHSAVAWGDLSQVKQILQEDPTTACDTLPDGRTPLHILLEHLQRSSSPEDQRPETFVKLLLEAGADINACDNYGRTPLEIAAGTEMAKLLKSRGGKILSEADKSVVQELLLAYRDATAPIVGRSIRSYETTLDPGNAVFVAGRHLSHQVENQNGRRVAKAEILGPGIRVNLLQGPQEHSPAEETTIQVTRFIQGSLSSHTYRRLEDLRQDDPAAWALYQQHQINLEAELIEGDWQINLAGYAMNGTGLPNGGQLGVAGFGNAAWPWLGVRVSEEPEGVRITKILPNSPAAAAGLKPGDICHKLGRFVIPNARGFAHLIARHDINQLVSLQVEREGKRRIVKLVLGRKNN